MPLNWPPGPPGMFSPPTPPPAPSGLMGAQQARVGGFGGFLNNNPGMLMALGAGLLGHRQNAIQNPMSSVFQQAMVGGAFDERRRERQKEEQSQNLTKNWLMSTKGLSEQDADAAVANPAILASMLKGGDSLISVGEGSALYNKDTGEWLQPPGGEGGMFRGTSAEAQGLNWLVGQNILTQRQAAEIAAGKTITGPNQEIIFMTPSGVFAQPPGGGPPQPIGPGTPPMPGQGAGQSPGMIPLTPGKRSGFTDTQSRSAAYADRMVKANEVLAKTERQGASVWGRGLSQVPGGNYLQSEEYQKFDQARRDFVNAVLRRESGAVISDEEFANAERQYFPQPGDTDDVIAQKRRNREEAIAGLIRDAGPAYQAPEAGVRRYNPQTGRIE